MTDISRERCERLAHNLRGDWYEATADLIIALRAALDAAEARERQAVEALQAPGRIIASNHVIKDGPHTVVLPDGSVHSGPVVDYLHSLMGMIQDYIAAAIRTGAKP